MAEPNVTDAPLTVVEKFNAAWNAGDLEATLALLAPDAVFENTSPAPDGERVTGREAIRAAWAPVFATPGMRFEQEEAVACGTRVVVRWRYHWRNPDGTPGSVRGIDLFTVRNGQIAAKLSYVKG